MQNKDQTFSKFHEFKALVEKESGKKIKALRSDNGGEYFSQEFKEFYAVEGIKCELTTPHNPKQNGVAERKGKTIVGAARAMLHDQAYHCTCGMRHAPQWSICRIEAHITYLG